MVAEHEVPQMRVAASAVNPGYKYGFLPLKFLLVSPIVTCRYDVVIIKLSV